MYKNDHSFGIFADHSSHSWAKQNTIDRQQLIHFRNKITALKRHNLRFALCSSNKLRQRPDPDMKERHMCNTLLKFPLLSTHR